MCSEKKEESNKFNKTFRLNWVTKEFQAWWGGGAHTTVVTQCAAQLAAGDTTIHNFPCQTANFQL